MNKKTKLEDTSFNSKTVSILIQISIVVLVFILYGKTLNYGFTLDDDLFYVKHKTVLQGISGIPQLFQENSLFGYFGKDNYDSYRPLTLSTFALQMEMVGVNAKAGHFINILLYILTGFVLFSFLKKMFSNWSVLLCGIIALLFIAHPIHTEVVCSLKSRDELLSCLFGLLLLRSLLINYQKNTISSYFLPGIWLALALFSKESSITYVALIPLVIYFKGEKSLKQIVVRTLPFIGIAGLFLLIRSQVLTLQPETDSELVINNVLYGASNFNELFGTRFYVLLLFFKQSLFPYFMSYDYSFNQIPLVGLSSPWVIFSILLHLGFLALIIFFVRKRNPIAFGLLFFFITSSVSNNFILKIGSTFADRFLFTPSLGMLIALFGVVFYFLKMSPELDKFNSKFKLLFASLFVFFSGLTMARVPVWENNYTLFQSGLDSAPNSARAQSGMASEFRVQAEQSTTIADRDYFYEKAKFHYWKSIEILPSYFESYYNLGVISFAETDTLTALKYYKKSLSFEPTYKLSLHNLSSIYSMQKEADSSLLYLKKYMKFYPEEKIDYVNLSYMYLLKKNYKMAKMYANQGIEKEPNDPGCYRNLAAAYSGEGDNETAKKYWQKFLDLGGQP